MSSIDPKLPYSALRTGDFDEEQPEVSELNTQNQSTSLQVLSESIQRLGQISLKLADEIELQDRSSHALEAEVEDANSQARQIDHQSRQVAHQSNRTSWFDCLLTSALFILIIVLFVLIWKKSK